MADPIDVIIPVFNRPEYTKLLLDSLYSVNHGVKIAPVIVDNASRKRTKSLITEWMAAYKPSEFVAEPRLITCLTNTGFAGALNRALEKTSEYVIIMHNDTLPFNGWAGEMYEGIKDDEDIAVIMPRTNYANEGSPCILEMRKQFETIKPCNKDRIEPQQIEEIIAKLIPDKEKFMAELAASKLRISYSPEISSFCMMVRSSLFKEFGKFDEDFWPRGFEDRFWFRAIERAGYVCMISNRAFVYHNGNTTSDGPGFSFPEIMKINEEKYKAKCLEIDRTTNGKTVGPNGLLAKEK